MLKEVSKARAGVRVEWGKKGYKSKGRIGKSYFFNY